MLFGWVFSNPNDTRRVIGAKLVLGLMVGALDMFPLLILLLYLATGKKRFPMQTSGVAKTQDSRKTIIKS